MGKKGYISILLLLLAAAPAAADLVARSPSIDLSTSLECHISGSRPVGLLAAFPPTVPDFGDAHDAQAWFHHASAMPPGIAPAMARPPAAGFAYEGAAASASSDLVELPPPPSSSTLTLSGLLTLGAVQAARSSRRAQLLRFSHIGHLPDWYHAGADQVGHSVPFESRVSVQPVLAFLSQVTREPPGPGALLRRLTADERIRSPQHTALLPIPRGPPLL